MKIDINLLKEHPLNFEIYGADEEEQFKILVNRIKESGWIHPIWVNKEGTILSGHRRYRAAKLLGYTEIEYEKVNVEPEKELEILLNSNVYREKTTIQKLKEAEYYYQIESRKARERQLAGVTLSQTEDQGRTDEIVADIVGMSRTSLRDGQEALKNSENIADEGLKHLSIETINVNIKAANKLSKQPFEVMKQVQDQIKGDVTQVGKVLRNLENIEIKKTIPLPPGKYHVIQTEYHIDDFEKCSKIPIGALAETDSVLFLWTLPPLLEEAMKLIQIWGFKYKTAFFWNLDVLKECSDLGEVMLIGIKGNPPMISLTNGNQPMTEKPKLIKEMMEQVYQPVDKVIIHIGEGWELW
jgi:hypothetical protein